MSDDSFYVRKGSRVWQGCASDIDSYLEDCDRLLCRAEVRWFRRLLRGKPVFEGADEREAARWADSQHAEYGVWLPPEGI